MANLRGEPFSLWAGPVSIATGIEYRTQSADQITDPIAQANGFVNSSVNQKAMSAEYNVRKLTSKRSCRWLGICRSPRSSI